MSLFEASLEILVLLCVNTLVWVELVQAGFSLMCAVCLLSSAVIYSDVWYRSALSVTRGCNASPPRRPAKPLILVISHPSSPLSPSLCSVTWHSGSLCPVTLLVCARPRTVVRSRSGQIRPLLQDNTPISVLHTHLCLSVLSCPAFLLWTLKRNQHAAFICCFFCWAHYNFKMETFRRHGHHLETNNLQATLRARSSSFNPSMESWMILEKVVTVAASLQPLNWWIKTKTFRLIRVVRNNGRYLCFCAVLSVSSN